MRGSLLVLDQVKSRNCAALIRNGILEELSIDPEDPNLPLPGAIYRAVAERSVKNQGGIFVKLPQGKRGFLRQISGISPGHPLIVQISGPPAEETKAFPVTTKLLFKSRYAIITPGAPGVNVSRLIKDQNRRNVLTSLAHKEMSKCPAELQPGLVLRSACEAADDDDISNDIIAMRELAEKILSDINGAPELLLDGATAHDLALRDWMASKPDTLHSDPGGFALYGVDIMMEDLLMPHVSLPEGANMIIEKTQALITVDVNTGINTSPATALKANISAARALPRTLLLRGLGGQIVVDFAPMPKKDRTIVDQVIRAAFKAISGRGVHIAGWTTLGLYEVIRGRDRYPLSWLCKGIL